MSSTIYNIYVKGQEKLFTEFDNNEKEKVGNLRGGNTGMLTETGEIIGSCAALTWLRWKGINIEGPDWSRELMFGGGRANEQIWLDVLSEGWDGKILAEEQIPTEWSTENGVLVTGRPDLVLCEIADDSIKELIKRFPKKKQEYLDLVPDSQVIPSVGIELKQISSLWTARDVMFQRAPKLNHLLQAAHYSWQLGIPFELWYTNRTDLAVTGDWAKNLFPKYGEENSEYCQYGYSKIGPDKNKYGNYVKRKISEDEFLYHLEKRKEKVSADVLKVLPFTKGYQLDIRNNKLWFKDAEHDAYGWTETIIDIGYIKDFYNYITKLEKINKVPDEPAVKKYDGKKGNYKQSDYCSLKELCCGKCKGQPLNKWVEKILTQQNKNNNIDINNSDTGSE